MIYHFQNWFTVSWFRYRLHWAHTKRQMTSTRIALLFIGKLTPANKRVYNGFHIFIINFHSSFLSMTVTVLAMVN